VVDGGERAAVVDAHPLSDFDDREHSAIEAHEVEFADFAAQVARQNLKTLGLKISGRELFRDRTALKTGQIGHGSEIASLGALRQPGNVAASWQNARVPQYRNNYVESVTKSLGELLRWQFERVRGRLPPAPTVPIPTVAADLDFVQGNAVAAAAMIPAVTWIGHATVLVQACGLNVLTDPIFSSRASPVQFAGPARVQAPGIALRDLPHIDVVVISHNHYDHLDRGSIQALARQAGGSPLFLVPLGIKAWLKRAGIERAVELNWGQMQVHEQVEFHFTPAQHWSGRSLGDRNQTLWGSWAVLGAQFHWFFSGDTGYSKDFRDTRERFAPRQTTAQGGAFDIALIAVGACLPRWFMKEQHVNLDEAMQIHLDLGAKRSVGVHWGTFSLADDPLDLPLHELADTRRGKGVADEEFLLLPVGGTRQLARRLEVHR
jgi:N-acyl-phosphatidylethanolamine-hydrolysing phospholipase D